MDKSSVALDGARCYGALGGTVYLQLIMNGFRKGNDAIEDKSDFLDQNGTFKLTNAEYSDSAKYFVELCDVLERTFHLIQRRGCPVPLRGDGFQYSWTLDGHTLKDTEPCHVDETNTVTLKKGLYGDLTSTV
ncbi:unnamed protein product, partial [Coregonus sp. 'balchen']